MAWAPGGTSLARFIDPANTSTVPTDSNTTWTWSDMTAAFASWFAELRTGGDTAELAGIVWFQGNQDTKNQGNGSLEADAYEADLTTLLADLRSTVDGGSNPSAPCVIIRSPDWLSQTSSTIYQATVRSAQVAVAAADPLAVWIDTDAPGGITATWEDTAHLDAATQERVGIDAGQAYLDNF